MVSSRKLDNSLAGLFAAVVVLAVFNLSPTFVNAPVPLSEARLRGTTLQTQKPFGGNADPSSSGSLAFAPTASALALLLVAGIAGFRQRSAITRFVSAPKKLKIETIPRPEKLLENPKFPLYVGGTNGYMSKATYERHAVTWSGKGEMEFEMPEGSTAVMNNGENLVYLRKKEHSVMLVKRLRKMKINDCKIYRIKKDGTVLFIHPVDGNWPENQTTGRPLINWRPFPISGNAEQASFRWTKYALRNYEADPLSTLFVKARQQAWWDQENVWPIPVINGFIPNSEEADYKAKVDAVMNEMKSL